MNVAISFAESLQIEAKEVVDNFYSEELFALGAGCDPTVSLDVVRGLYDVTDKMLPEFKEEIVLWEGRLATTFHDNLPFLLNELYKFFGDKEADVNAIMKSREWLFRERVSSGPPQAYLEPFKSALTVLLHGCRGARQVMADTFTKNILPSPEVSCSGHSYSQNALYNSSRLAPAAGTAAPDSFQAVLAAKFPQMSLDTAAFASPPLAVPPPGMAEFPVIPPADVAVSRDEIVPGHCPPAADSEPR